MTAKPLIALALAVGLAPGTQAWAGGAPAALVMDYSGYSNLRLQAFSELADGAVVRLGERERLTLLHYKSCRRMTVTGGQVAVSAGGINAQGGKLQEDVQGNCPEEIDAALSAKEPQKVSAIAPALDCVVVGGQAGDVGSIEIMEGAAMVQSVPVQGNRVISAPAARPLAAGREYTLVIKDIGGKALDQVVVDVGASQGEGPKACLIRVQ